MGQKITKGQREVLSQRPEVKTVTAEHVILKNGTVMDPIDFVIEHCRLWLACKLLECRCQPWKLHKPGTHVIVEVIAERTVLGYRPTAIMYPFCKDGRWTTEETLTEEQARAFGLDVK
jgi:hypothetical protein